MINNKNFSKEIINIATEIKNNNGSLFLVGGSVRDLILGIQPEEYDFEIYGDSLIKGNYNLLCDEEKESYSQLFIKNMKEILEKFGPIKETGKNFGVIKMAHKPYDFSFPRTENKSGITRKDYNIILNPFIEFKEAQKRRDITINTIMYSFNNEKIIDNYYGLEDIKNKIIRHVDGDTFIEDPLRIYRIAQFVSRLEFSVDQKTMNLCKSMDLNSLSIERIQWEIEKLFKGKDILSGILFLNDSNVLLKRHPEFYIFFNQKKEKHKDINKIKLYFKEEMKMTERFVFLFLLFLENEDIDNFQKKIKIILNTFTTNKKDVQEALDTLKMIYIILNFSNKKITFRDALFLLINNKVRFLKEYCVFLIGPSSEVINLIDAASNFKNEVTGKDLLEIGIKESDNFKNILMDAVKLQIEGLSKKEILLKIKRREKL